MQPYSQPAGAPAFSPSQFASPGQFSNTPFGNQSFSSQPGLGYGAPSGGSQPFLTDPTAAYAQQPQLQPQQQQQPQFAQPFTPPGLFGFPQGQQSQPFTPPGLFGFPQGQQSQPFTPPGLFGFPQIGAGQFPRLPFLPDPILAAYAHQLQQAQLAQQFAPSPFFGSPLGQFAQPFIPGANLINPAFAQLGGAAQFPRPSPFADPLAAIYAQQLLQAQLAQQFTPPGFFGAPLPQFAQPQPFGAAPIFANPALAAASQWGRYPPFAAPILH